jgi:hypothetical protein
MEQGVKPPGLVIVVAHSKWRGNLHETLGSLLHSVSSVIHTCSGSGSGSGSGESPFHHRERVDVCAEMRKFLHDGGWMEDGWRTGERWG